MRLIRLFSALESRNYRLFMAGQLVSLTGNWMTLTASYWLIYHLSSSAFLLGLVGFIGQAPIFFLGPFAGVWVDRVNRHHLMIGTQICSMLQSFALAAFALSGTIGIPHLMVLSLAQGIINAVDVPTRQALVVEFVGHKKHLGNAIALNSSLFNFARLLGPAIGGFVIAAAGPGICYLSDGISYAAVILALLAMRLPRPAPAAATPHPWIGLKQGFHSALGFPPIRALILVVAAISATGFSYTVLMPVFARDVFHGDARTLGYLMSASGVGALAGAMYLAMRATIRGLGGVIAFGGGAMGVALIGLAWSAWLPMALLCVTIAGMGGVLLMASSNTLVQTLVEDDKRGRVMSIFSMAFTGTMPIGNLLVGFLAGRWGTAATLTATGIVCAAIAFRFLRSLPRLRKAASERLAQLDPAFFEPIVHPAANFEKK